MRSRYFSQLQSIYESLHAASPDIPPFFLVRQASDTDKYETAPITEYSSFLSNVAPEKVGQFPRFPPLGISHELSSSVSSPSWIPRQPRKTPAGRFATCYHTSRISILPRATTFSVGGTPNFRKPINLGRVGGESSLLKTP